MKKIGPRKGARPNLYYLDPTTGMISIYKIYVILYTNTVTFSPNRTGFEVLDPLWELMEHIKILSQPVHKKTEAHFSEDPKKVRFEV